jgi:hypothetical protein
VATTEHTINDAIADLLRETRQAWRAPNAVRSENTGQVKGSSAQFDILVLEPNSSPVVVETEVLPATTVEQDACVRLGTQLRSTGSRILSSVAVRLPIRLRSKSGKSLRQELAAAPDLEMALYMGQSPTALSRWPDAGWVTGTIADLSTLVQMATVPQAVVDAAADQLVHGVSEAAGVLGEIASKNSGAIHKISVELRQEDGEQTRRMAATILANAVVFHETLAGGPGELAAVKSIEELRGRSGAIDKSAVLEQWRKILTVNYWPIFDIARRILEVIPAASAPQLMEILGRTASALLATKLMRSHDLTGAVFQQLISDRKFLAAFYTTPAAAALLIGLAIRSDAAPSGTPWQEPEALRKLRFADFACGTGTLLSTAYQRVGQLHELAGGNADALHPDMMAHVLVGCDVLPAAAHLTASMLSGAHPTTTYEHSAIFTIAYGRQEDGQIALGSLDLLTNQVRLRVVDIAATAKAISATGELDRETAEQLGHGAFDLVVMNPPFTRATGHEGKKIGVPVPMFAAFASTEEEQRIMSAATRKLTKGTSVHGNAGEASIFLVLADRKIRMGGTIGLVMPSSLVSGEAWESSRALLRKNYDGLTVVTIAGFEDRDLSFSADTSMGECLVVGHRSRSGSDRATFLVLRKRPDRPLEGMWIARELERVLRTAGVRRLEDGPVGGTPISVGDQVIGEALNAPLPAEGGWNVARISDLSLAQAAYQFAKDGCVWLPTMNQTETFNVPLGTIGGVGTVGPYHMDVNASTSTGGVRGPFDIMEVREHAVPTYPVLWAHEAERERSLCFEAESEGRPKRWTTPQEKTLIEEKVRAVWATASHAHFNRDFRFNSQSVAMQFTKRKTIGGRAWLSISLKSVEREKVLVLWGNTSLGLMLHWWHANKQQAGRGSIGKGGLPHLATLDVDSLDPSALQRAVQLFDELNEVPFKPVHELASDDARRLLDERFVAEVLGVKNLSGPLSVLRSKLAAEPSVRGGKGSEGETEDSSDEG